MTDQVKDNIAMCGYCLIEEVKDLNTSIDFESKMVTYDILLPANLYDNLMLIEKFKSGEDIGFFNSIKLKKFLKNKADKDETSMGYDLQAIANKFIKSYLNNEWSVKVNVFKENKNGRQDFWLRIGRDKQTD
jgi:hypothetical protein